MGDWDVVRKGAADDWSVTGKSSDGSAQGGSDLPGDQWFGWAKNAAKKLWETGDLGPIQFGTGFRQIGKIPEDIRTGRYANAASDLIEGGGRVAAPIGLAAAAASGVGLVPLLVGGATAMGVGAAGAAAGESAAKLAGAGPDVERLSGNIGGLLGGEAGGRYGHLPVEGLLNATAALRGKLPLSTRQGSSLNDVDAKAMDYAVANPELRKTLDMGTVTGNRVLRTARDLLQVVPGTGAGKKLQAELTGVGEHVKGLGEDFAPGASTDVAAAGALTDRRVGQQLESYKTAADDAYGKLYEIANKNPVRVQTGTREVPPQFSSVLDQSGKPVMLSPGRQEPVYEDIRGPVNTFGAKTVAAPWRARLAKSMNETQRALSPTMNLLDDIMNRPGVVDMETAIDDVSRLGSMASQEKLPNIRDLSSKIAGQLFGEYRDSLDAAAFRLGPEAEAALDRGRAFTKGKHDLAEALPMRTSPDPGAIAKRALLSNDSGIEALEAVRNHTPGALPDITRAATEQITGPATQGGDIENVKSAINRFSALGPRTKNILWTPEQQNAIEQSLRYALRVRSTTNISGTAPANLLAKVAKGLLLKPIASTLHLGGARAFSNRLFDPERAAQTWLNYRNPPPPTRVRMPGLLYGTGAGIGAETAPYVDRDVIDERPDARSLLGLY